MRPIFLFLLLMQAITVAIATAEEIRPQVKARVAAIDASVETLTQRFVQTITGFNLSLNVDGAVTPKLPSTIDQMDRLDYIRLEAFFQIEAKRINALPSPLPVGVALNAAETAELKRAKKGIEHVSALLDQLFIITPESIRKMTIAETELLKNKFEMESPKPVLTEIEITALAHDVSAETILNELITVFAQVEESPIFLEIAAILAKRVVVIARTLSPDIDMQISEAMMALTDAFITRNVVPGHFTQKFLREISYDHRFSALVRAQAGCILAREARLGRITMVQALAKEEIALIVAGLKGPTLRHESAHLGFIDQELKHMGYGSRAMLCESLVLKK